MSNGTLNRSGSNAHHLIVRGKSARGKKITFGSVAISGLSPSADDVKSNVARSTDALARVTKRLEKPGEALRSKRDVSQFSVADGEVGVLVRQLNGQTERGRLIDGQFRVTDRARWTLRSNRSCKLSARLKS